MMGRLNGAHDCHGRDELRFCCCCSLRCSAAGAAAVAGAAELSVSYNICDRCQPDLRRGGTLSRR